MVYCICGFETKIRTSRTSQNPGRRFHCCNRPGKSCGFVCWAKPPLYVPTLTIKLEYQSDSAAKVRKLQEVAQRFKSENATLKMILGVTLLFVVLYFFCK
ncbi:putative transcription factor GRF family [Helianthus annuus]|nr:putative transcription factor GRF family [Helianthus annuus]